MRYEKAERVLDLVNEMQARRQGISLDEIERKFEVGRRTAMRMRDAALRLNPEVEEILGEDRRKRWRIRQTLPKAAPVLTADDFADLQATIRLLKREHQTRRARALESIATRLKAALPAPAAARIEPDLEALLEAEGLARRPGPRPRIDDDVLTILRLAIKAGREVYLTHTNRQTARRKGRHVQPYGFLFGNRHYLVARVARAEPPIRLFALSGIRQVRLTPRPFVREEGFSLDAFANQAFGAFQEAPRDIVWRFAPRAAAVAEEFQFHPSQRLERTRDGTLIVRFRAGGLQEMCWHLWTWGREVEVLEPVELRRMWLAGPMVTHWANRKQAAP